MSNDDHNFIERYASLTHGWLLIPTMFPSAAEDIGIAVAVGIFVLQKDIQNNSQGSTLLGRWTQLLGRAYVMAWSHTHKSCAAAEISIPPVDNSRKKLSLVETEKRTVHNPSLDPLYHIMPGVKRKAAAPASKLAGSSSSSSSSKGKSAKLDAPSKLSQPESSEDEDDSADGSDDEFDDGEDLMAASRSNKAGFETLEEESSAADDDDQYEDSAGDSDGFEDLEGQGDVDMNEDQEPSSSSKRQKNAHLYAPPTNEEMQGLRETGNLFKTNILKLQIEEMLNNVRPPYHRQSPLETALRRVHELFSSISPIQPQPISDAQQAIQNLYPSSHVHIPFPDPQPTSSANYKLAFQPPTQMQIVGSWPLKSATLRPEGFDVDLAVVMPSDIFQEKDHLNMRYFHKRAFYLAVLAAALKSSSKKLGLDAAYELEDGDSKKPLLVLRPINDKSDTDFTKLKAEIRIHLAHQLDVFPIGRLAPSRNNFRSSSDTDAESSTTTTPAPTPRYNTAILADSLRTHHLVYLHAAAKACPAFADACALLKVWAFQRGFGAGSSKSASPRRTVLGTDNARFVLTMVLAHLLHGEERSTSSSRLAPRAKLANSFSSHQLFRGVIDWLANHPFKDQPVFMKAAASAGVPSFHAKIEKEDFARHFDCSIVDPSGSLNLVANWSLGSLDLLQHEAKITAAMLDDADTDHFDELFLTPRTTPLSVFDDCATVNLSALPHTTKLGKVDYGSEQRCSASIVAQTIRRGLSGRAQLVSCLVPSQARDTRAWAVDTPRRSASKRQSSNVEFGMVYNGALALRSVEHGPPPESKEEAASFQQFWGDVAELRRFKDGRILLSVVWEITSQSERWGIPRRIVRHLLHRLELPSASKVTYYGEAFDGLTSIPRAIADRAFLASPEEKGFQMVQSAFDTLARQLRAMQDLPLSLTSVSPNAAGLRGTSTMIPGPVNLGGLGSSIPDSASYIPAQEIVLTFESSGRWPDELKAIQAMKIAFLERMAVLLPSKLPGMQAHVALDEDAERSEIRDQVSLEMILPSGFAFRARIHHDRERVLLERVISDKRDTPLAQREEASRALARFTRRFIHGPSHHAAISALTHRFVAFGETIRLVKRWISAQMMDGHVSEEALELVVASVFICPGSSTTSAPSTGSAGFVQVLNKLAKWKWTEEPLLLPLQAVVRAADDASLQTVRMPTDGSVAVLESFKKHRQSDPGLSNRAWFIATEEDLTGDRWGHSSGPSGPIAHTLQELARGAMNLLGTLSPPSQETIRAIYTPSSKPYHFLIHIKPGVSPRYVEALSADPQVYSHDKKSKSFRNNGTTSSTTSLLYGSTPRVAFDPISSYVSLLRGIYGDSVRLHYDRHGHTIIGGLFNPTLVTKERKFKVGLGFNSLPVDGNESVKLNYKAILVEMERLGQGLVDRVEVQMEF